MSPLPKFDTRLPFVNDNVPQSAGNVAPDGPFRRFVDGQYEKASYLIKGILPLYGVALLAGQFSSGKTFVALDIALSLICGEQFLGRKTKSGAVLWFAAEGAGILEQRLVAARSAKFKARIAAEKFPFLWEDGVPKGDTDTILADLKLKIRSAKGECDEHHTDLPLRLVVIDTLAAFFALKDENDNAEAATFMARLGEIAREMRVLIMPICHIGKNAEGGIRGASAFGAGADGAIAVLASINQATGEVDGARTISLAKTRGGIPGPLSSFQIEQVIIGTDEDGDPIPAGYVTFTPLGTSSKGKKPTRGVRDLIASINEVMLTHGQDLQPFEDAHARRAVRVDHVRHEFMRRHGVGDSTDTAAKRQAYRRALERVLEDQLYIVREVAGIEYIWPIQV